MNYMNTGKLQALTDSTTGSRVRIDSISGGDKLRDKLLSMGILPGKEIEILSARKNGPVIVKINDTRVVIGHGMASRILINPTRY